MTDEQDKQTSEQPPSIEYIIGYSSEKREQLEKALDSFEVNYFKLVPYASVKVPKEKEESFLEQLTKLDVTYKRSAPRRALENPNEK